MRPGVSWRSHGRLSLFIFICPEDMWGWNLTEPALIHRHPRRCTHPIAFPTWVSSFTPESLRP